MTKELVKAESTHEKGLEREKEREIGGNVKQFLKPWLIALPLCMSNRERDVYQLLFTYGLSTDSHWESLLFSKGEIYDLHKGLWLHNTILNKMSRVYFTLALGRLRTHFSNSQMHSEQEIKWILSYVNSFYCVLLFLLTHTHTYMRTHTHTYTHDIVQHIWLLTLRSRVWFSAFPNCLSILCLEWSPSSFARKIR